MLDISLNRLVLEFLLFANANLEHDTNPGALSLGGALSSISLHIERAPPLRNSLNLFCSSMYLYIVLIFCNIAIFLVQLCIVYFCIFRTAYC